MSQQCFREAGTLGVCSSRRHTRPDWIGMLFSMSAHDCHLAQKILTIDGRRLDCIEHGNQTNERYGVQGQFQRVREGVGRGKG